MAQFNHSFWDTLRKDAVFSTWTRGPGGNLYAAYLLADSNGRGTCHLYISRWDGYKQKLVFSYDGDAGCEAMNWDLEQFSTQEKDVLSLDGFWSDINQNGLPEFTIYQYSGCQACNEVNSGRMKVFEIQAPDQLVDIVSNTTDQINFAPGALIQSVYPFTISMVRYTYYDINAYYAVKRLYSWQTDRYIEVSARYPEFFRQQAKALAAGSKDAYRHFGNAVAILALYNEFNLPQKQGLDLFLASTERPVILTPERGLFKFYECWRQLARAYAQTDYEQHMPFRNLTTGDLTDATNQSHTMAWADQTKSLRAGIDEKRFDVSACK